MTPEQKLKWAILAKVPEWEKTPPPAYPCSNVDELYTQLVERDALWDAQSEVRGSGVETKLKCEWSRHYESKAVAMRMPDGTWVGWTYWYGGGKHGEPEAVEWMEHAYEVNYSSEQKMVTVETFTVANAPGERLPTKMKTTLIVAVLNELEGLRQIMPCIKDEWVDQIIILDGGSTDGSLEWARAHCYLDTVGIESFAKDTKYLLYQQKKSGLRQGYKEVWPFVSGDVVLTFSPDGNSIAEAIPTMIARMKEKDYDMVIASRYLPPATSDDDTMLTGFGNWMFTKLINLLHGGAYTDAMGIYRIFRRGLPNELGVDDERKYWVERLLGTEVSWEPLLSVMAARGSCSISEIAASEPPRLGGVPKRQTWKWGMVFLWQTIAACFRSPSRWFDGTTQQEKR